MAGGTLRIYLGAAPGVGKTFSMLSEGTRRASRGTNLVVGFVESHRRPNTEAAIGALELVPRRSLIYSGRRFEEMDLDAIVARAPEVVLVDELAHTNVPGSRHEKRWEDVEDLLAAGIDATRASSSPNPNASCSARCGVPTPTTRRTTCGSSWPRSAANSNRNRRVPATSSPSPGWDTASRPESSCPRRRP
jgi:Osmosensitive K+ channel His kinase sensor domain